MKKQIIQTAVNEYAKLFDDRNILKVYSAYIQLEHVANQYNMPQQDIDKLLEEYKTAVKRYKAINNQLNMASIRSLKTGILPVDQNDLLTERSNLEAYWT